MRAASLEWRARFALPALRPGRQPLPFSRRIHARVMRSRSPPKSEGGAGRRGPGAQAKPAGTHGLAPLAKRKRNDISRSDIVRICSPQVRQFSDVPRAVLEA